MWDLMRKTIVIHHWIGGYPVGGMGWEVASYIVGLGRLGYNIYYVEEAWCQPYHPWGKGYTADCSYSVAFIKNTMERFGLEDRWAYLNNYYHAYYGFSREKLSRLYREADALINFSGSIYLRKEHLNCPIRIYLETDPGYEQIKLASGNKNTFEHLNAHTHHFTYGENLGNSDSPIPLEKFDWKKTRPHYITSYFPPHSSYRITSNPMMDYNCFSH